MRFHRKGNVFCIFQSNLFLFFTTHGNNTTNSLTIGELASGIISTASEEISPNVQGY